MTIKELRKLKNEELQKMLLENREKLRESRFNLSSGKTKNIKEVREARRQIAQILTIIKENA